MTYSIGMTAMSIVLEIDPNVVKPGWTPLLILIALALVMALLFRSMKRQFRRVHTNFPEASRPGTDAELDAPAVEPGSDAAPSGTTVPGEQRAPSR